MTLSQVASPVSESEMTANQLADRFAPLRRVSMRLCVVLSLHRIFAATPWLDTRECSFAECAGRGAISLGNPRQQRFFFDELACPFQTEPPMLKFITKPYENRILVCALITTISLSLRAGTSAQEKAFIDKYKAAFETKDTATLESFLYTQGADPAILGFYKMMQSSEAGEKITTIDLVDVTPEDAKKAAAPQD